MRQRESETGAEVTDSWRAWGAALRRTAVSSTRQSVALVFLLTTAVEFGLMTLLEELAPGGLHGSFGEFSVAPSSTGLFVGAVLGLILVTALRNALFHPARRAYRGDELTLREATTGALWRTFPVLVTSLAIGVLIGGVALVCTALGLRMALFVLLPAQFALAPAIYVSATRKPGASESIRRALELSRRHWFAVFGAHSLGELAVVAWSSAVASTLELPTLGLLAGFLAVRFLGWWIVAGTYLYLDEG